MKSPFSTCSCGEFNYTASIAGFSDEASVEIFRKFKTMGVISRELVDRPQDFLIEFPSIKSAIESGYGKEDYFCLLDGGVVMKKK